MGLKVEDGRERGPKLTVAELRKIVETEETEGRIWIDDAEDYFLPSTAPKEGGVEGVLFSPGPEIVFIYHYGKDNPQTFREVHQPLKLTLTFN